MHLGDFGDCKSRLNSLFFLGIPRVLGPDPALYPHHYVPYPIYWFMPVHGFSERGTDL